MGERVRWRLAANVGVVMGLFASVLALAAVAAPEARADGGTCTKAAAGDGVSLTIDGFAAEDSAAVRRNGKWLTTVDDLAVPVSASGSVDDDWKLRVRGPGQPDPYLEVTCAAAPVGGAATCTIVDDGSLRAEFAGFGANDALNLRRNGKWVATADGAVTSIDNLPGTPDDTWTLRARGADFEEPYSTIECDTGDVAPPPPPADSFCRVTDAGLEWDDAGVDQYQVRRNGKWVATATARSYPTDDLEADWIVRYRLGGERIDQTCERGDAEPSPCIILGETVDSVMDGPQCQFAEAYLLEAGEIALGNPVSDPCNRGTFICDETAVLQLQLQFFVPDGLRHFTDATYIMIEDAQVDFEDVGQMQSLRIANFEFLQDVTVSAGIGNLSNLEFLSFFASEIETLPPEIGQLTELRGLDLFDSTITSLPEEVGQLKKLEFIELFGSSLRSIPESIGELDSLTSLQVPSQVESLPSTIYDGESLEGLLIESAVLTEMPLADAPPPALRDITFFDAISLAGDQSAWLTSLGDPEELQMTVFFDTDGCRVWVTDPAWDAWLSANDDGFAENCRPPA